MTLGQKTIQKRKNFKYKTTSEQIVDKKKKANDTNQWEDTHLISSYSTKETNKPQVEPTSNQSSENTDIRSSNSPLATVSGTPVMISSSSTLPQKQENIKRMFVLSLITLIVCRLIFADEFIPVPIKEKVFTTIKPVSSAIRRIFENLRFNNNPQILPYNHAAGSCGARASGLGQHVQAILDKDKDKYFLAYSTMPIQLEIELCHGIRVDSVELRSYERLSSTTKDFSLYGAMKAKDRQHTEWMHLLTATAENTKNPQKFIIPQPQWVNLLRLVIKTHYGKHKLFTLSQFLAYGKTVFEDVQGDDVEVSTMEHFLIGTEKEKEETIQTEKADFTSLKVNASNPSELLKGLKALFKKEEQQANMYQSVLERNKIMLSDMNNKSKDLVDEIKQLNDTVLTIMNKLINQQDDMIFCKQLCYFLLGLFIALFVPILCYLGSHCGTKRGLNKKRFCAH